MLSPDQKICTVLLVEDDPLIRFSAAEMLREVGFAVVEAAHGDEALRHLDREDIQILMTDINLPGMSGKEVAREVLARKPGIHVVFATGEGFVPDAGGAVVLRKPYDMRALVAALDPLRNK